MTIVVTASDGTTERTYQITFDRTSAELTSLVASAGALSPLFVPATIAYGVGPALLDQTSTLTPTARDSGATIHVNLLPTPSGMPSADFTLSGGLTPVTVDVTARDGSTKTYTVVFNRAVGGQDAYFRASNTGSGDTFGTSAAISGNTLVVGARTEDSSATDANGDQSDNSASNAGAAYVFVRTGTSWSQQAYLKALNAGTGDRFGVSLAIFGDTLIVGADFEKSNATGVNGNQTDNSAGDADAAYAFR